MTTERPAPLPASFVWLDGFSPQLSPGTPGFFLSICVRYSRTRPARRNSGSVVASSARITGPMRRCSTSQRRDPGSQTPPARCTMWANSFGLRTATRVGAGHPALADRASAHRSRPPSPPTHDRSAVPAGGGGSGLKPRRFARTELASAARCVATVSAGDRCRSGGRIGHLGLEPLAAADLMTAAALAQPAPRTRASRVILLQRWATQGGEALAQRMPSPNPGASESFSMILRSAGRTTCRFRSCSRLPFSRLIEFIPQRLSPPIAWRGAMRPVHAWEESLQSQDNASRSGSRAPQAQLEDEHSHWGGEQSAL